MLDVFADTPTGNQRGPPSTRFARAEQKLHPSASPLWGEAGWKKDKLQNQVYTGLLDGVRQRIALPPEQMFDGLLDDIRQFSGNAEFEDDVCLVGMEVTKRLSELSCVPA